MPLPSLASFWHGGPLGGLEMASLHSFVVLGHPVVVYSYAPLPDLPAGIEARDAAELLPTRKVVLNRETGSPALHANLVRYAMMAKTDHIWVDLDVVALRPLVFAQPHVFAFETDRQVNNAVLRLPKDSRALARLLRLRPDTRGAPPGSSWRRRLKLWLRTRGRGLPIEDWRWGSAGPIALTDALRRTGEIRHALRPESIYPISHRNHLQLLEPGLGPDSFGPETLAVHLWAKDIRRAMAERYAGGPPASTFVGWAMHRAARDGFAPSASPDAARIGQAADPTIE